MFSQSVSLKAIYLLCDLVVVLLWNVGALSLRDLASGVNAMGPGNAGALGN